MQYNNKNSVKVTALYARFSRNDSDDESNSIANQRKILQNYAKEKGFSCTRFYADDGISGTTFDRPEFKRMLADIENGEIETVIVKDLSRFGRLSSMVGYYTDFYFPQNSIRFIAVIDDVDSDNGDNEFAPFKNIFNEWYARDTSRKIRETLKNKGENGGILCVKPIFGYKKDPDNKNHWLIDDEAAEIVRLIFDYCTKDGMGTTLIATALRNGGVPTPRQYFLKKELIKENPEKDKNLCWEITTIRGILRNRAYCGDVVNFKTYRKSYKDHKMYKNAPENYRVFEGVNDPIISEEQFRVAQEILDKKRRVPTVREPDMFQGYIYCANCGKRLSIRRAYRKGDVAVYVCNTYRRNPEMCTSHYTRRDILEEFTLKQVRRLLHTAKDSLDVFVQKLQSDMDVNTKKDLQKVKRELKKLQSRSSELNKIIAKLYEDMALGKITEERYSVMVTDFEKEQKEIDLKIEDFQAKLCTESKTSELIERFVETISKYKDVDVTELNQYVLLDLVDKINIRQKEDGQSYEDVIDIYFKCIGNIFFEG
ncbi:MAG: recombinase family protein [Ruminococcus sp.]|nr:recombinase family protein [Ruminococcus sp.]MCM1480905.1 recombinase family protein [Muribaculaceae bacterium]